MTIEGDAMTSKTLKQAEINHLRRLVAWVDCEIGQSPEEFVATVKDIAPHIDELSDGAKQRLVESHEKKASVPKYVRQAVKALRKTLAGTEGDTVDAELVDDPSDENAIGHEGKQKLLE
jgi:hypothetical protein